MDHRGSPKEEGPVSSERGLLYLWQAGGCTEELCPDRVLLPRPVLQAALGSCHVLLLAQGGLVYGFGRMPWRSPQPVPATSPEVERSLLGQTVVRVVAGDLHCGAITQQGALYMWGDNSAGQCGLTGTREASPAFVPEPAAVSMVDNELVPPAMVKVVELACGREHTLALSAQHELWAWGTGCQLGLVTSCFPVWKPQKVEHLTGRHVIQVVCGSYHSLALVRRLPPQNYTTQNTSEQCGRCQAEIPKTEHEESVVVDHTQYCPLGVELAGTTPGKGCSRQSSPCRRLSFTGRSAAARPGSGSSPCPNPEGLKLGPSTGDVNTTQAQPDPGRNADPLTQTVSSLKACALARNSKKTAFPDEVEIREFLHKLSSKSLEEQDVRHDTDAGETDSLSSQMSELSTELSGSSYEDDPAVNRHPRTSPCDPAAYSSGLCEDEVRVHVDLEAKGSPQSAHVSVEKFRLKTRHATSPSHGSPGCRGSPRGRPAPGGQGTHATGGSEDELPCLDTEVWSWGRGTEGQLGHGDQLDRLQPLCVESLTGGQVVKLSAGSHHSLALTVLCQVYSWGSNNCGQLGHLSLPVTTPQQVKLSDDMHVWDVSAGRNHSLLLADGDCVQPIIYYCGQQQESPPGQTTPRGQRSPSRAETYTVRPLLLPFCMEMGFVSSVCSGGVSCAALADRNVMGFISALHDLASRERLSYCGTHTIHTRFLKPLVDRENVCSSLGEPCGHLFRALSESFLRLSVLTGRHSASLNNFLRGAQCRDVTTLPLLTQRSLFLEAYKEYCSALGDFQVMSGFQSLPKLTVQCFGQRLDGIFKQCGVDESAPGDLLINLVYQPIQHLNQYSTSLLKLATCYDPSTTEYMYLYQSYMQLESASRALWRSRKDAERTCVFWENHSARAIGALCRPERRLVCESTDRSLTLLNTGIFSSNTFILFNDMLVHMQFSTYRVFPLTCLWVKAVSEDSTGVNGIKIICPEETFTLVASTPHEKNKWLCAMRQAIEQALGGGSGAEGSWPAGTGVAALCRTASYTFRGEGSLKDAHYSGAWTAGKPHGRGSLTWADGRRYTGNFKNGCVDGYGECEIPNRLNNPDYYQGHWRDGKIHGFGKYKYASGELYEGCFYDGQRHGYGMLSSGRLGKASSSIFIGHWVHDKKTGYGVLHDITRGEKYLGLWQDDQKQGEAVVVTQSSLYFEGTFKDNKMTGPGLLVAEDNTSFQGEFSEDWTVNGKGVLTLSNGDLLEGVFSGEWSRGLKVNGTYNRPDTGDTGLLHPPGCGGGGVADRWSCVFEEFWRRLGCPLDGRRNRSNAWDSIAVTISTALKHSRDLSRRHRKALESLERIPQLEDKITSMQYDDIKHYLSKACATPLHPLGWLLETLVSVFRMSYLGLSNHRLLPSAVQEVKSCVSQLYSIVRFLFPGLPEEGGDIRGPSDETALPGSVSLLPLVLPGLYPPLFSLYCQEEDARAEPVYWDRLLQLNNQPDQSLLTSLGVQPSFWPVTVSVQGERKQITSSSKDLCFWSAVETLRQISSKFCPSDKLLVIQGAIEQLTQDVKGLLGSEYLWSMDDLFPLFLYVVVRARIKMLGAEVRLIEDLMDATLKHGELELIFTTLKACHFHIQHEKTP